MTLTICHSFFSCIHCWLLRQSSQMFIFGLACFWKSPESILCIIPYLHQQCSLRLCLWDLALKLASSDVIQVDTNTLSLSSALSVTQNTALLVCNNQTPSMFKVWAFSLNCTSRTAEASFFCLFLRLRLIPVDLFELESCDLSVWESIKTSWWLHLL